MSLGTLIIEIKDRKLYVVLGGCFMLKKRKQSKHLWKTTTTANRRKRMLTNNKQKVLNRHRAFLQFME